MRKFLRDTTRYMFVGPFNKEEIPNRKVRWLAIATAYSALWYQLRVQYLESKLDIMDREGLIRLSFTDWLRYQEFHGTADLVESITTKLLYAEFPIEDTDGTRYAAFSDEEPDFNSLTS